MEPAAKVGPSWNESILDRAILFLKKRNSGVYLSEDLDDLD